MKQRLNIYSRYVTFTSVLTLLFAISQLIVIRYHEMWRDELQAWLIAKNSTNIPNLYHNLRYEGHPPLWHLLLFVLTRVTSNPIAMQLLSVAIATLTVYLIARYAPFSKLQKILLSFGYFTFYEYGIIARDYSLGYLLIIIFCILITSTRKNYWLLGTCLFLLPLTNDMSALVTPILTLYMLLDFIKVKGLNLKRIHREHVFAIAAPIVGVCLFYLVVKPPSDSGVVVQGYKDLVNTVNGIWKSYAPIPARTTSFWNTNILSPKQALIGALIILVSTTFAFLRKWRVLLVYLLASGFVMGFLYFLYPGVLRHQGYLFIVFISCMWLLKYELSDQKPLHHKQISYQHTILTLVLLAQFLANGVAVYKDICLPFSDAKATAIYIHRSSLDKLPIATDLDYTASPVGAYLNKKIFYVQINNWGSFVVWNKARLAPVNDNLIVTRSRTLAENENRNILLLLNHPIDLTHYPDITYRSQFTGPDIVLDEKYYLYVLQSNNLLK